MSESFPCSVCGAPATVHLTQINNSQVTKVHFCEKCAAQNGAVKSTLSPIAHALSALQPLHSAPTAVCPECGCSEADFITTHRLGCPACYTAFSSQLDHLLPKLQPGPNHQGKMPSGKTFQSAVQDALDNARKSMRVAIDTEAYEDAARLRDEIRQLEEALSGAARNDTAD